MPIWEWILIAAVAVVVVVAAAVVISMISFRSKTKRLKQHYGTEYERVLDETGSEKGAVRELTTRERKRDKLDIVPLSPSAHSDFTARWQEVQAGFVDNPATAVGVADRLVTEVMRQRGYPVDDFDRRAADISVDHPQIVDNYRAAHGIHVTSSSMPTPSNSERRSCITGRCSRSCSKPRPTNEAVTGGKRMTIHEEQPVTAEPRIDDENTADAVRENRAASTLTRYESQSRRRTADAVREPEPAADAVEAEPAEGGPRIVNRRNAFRRRRCRGSACAVGRRSGRIRGQSQGLRPEGRPPGFRSGRAPHDRIRSGTVAAGRTVVARAGGLH